MANLDEELLARQEEFEARQQQERMQRQQEQQRQQSLKNRAVNQAKQQVKQVVKKRAKQAAGRLLIATAPYWGPVALVIVGFIFLLFIVIAVPVAACQASWFDGLDVATVKLAVAWMPGDVCAEIESLGGRSGGGGASGEFEGGIEIVLTSAYRAGAITASGTPSAHGRGEAIDIALRNPTVPAGGTDPRIAPLIQIARSLGFTSPTGDVLNEYANPAENATGGHIHIEFNNGYCSGSPAANPPTDLVSLSGSVRVEGASDPRVRNCLLPYVIQIFQQAAAYNVPTTP